MLFTNKQYLSKKFLKIRITIFINRAIKLVISCNKRIILNSLKEVIKTIRLQLLNAKSI